MTIDNAKELQMNIARGKKVHSIAVDFVMYIDDVSAGGICSRGDFTA